VSGPTLSARAGDVDYFHQRGGLLFENYMQIVLSFKGEIEVSCVSDSSPRSVVKLYYMIAVRSAKGPKPWIGYGKGG
jgi:hypothetical protein